MYDHQQPTEHNGKTAQAVLLGVGIGVVGTLLIVAANQDRFNRTVDRSRDMTNRAKEAVGEFAHNVADKAHDVLLTAKNSVHRTAEKVADLADDVESKTRV